MQLAQLAITSVMTLRRKLKLNCHPRKIEFRYQLFFLSTILGNGYYKYILKCLYLHKICNFETVFFTAYFSCIFNFKYYFMER